MTRATHRLSRRRSRRAVCEKPYRLSVAPRTGRSSADIWGPGYADVVPTPILTVTVQRGGILIGAFADDRMIGFVYSLPGIKYGRPTQWSHMLGVVDDFRSDGIGYQLKLLQRDRALGMGLDLIEWTFDPLQAMNAHLNFTKA